MTRIWPQAPIYTSIYDEGVVGDLFARSRVRTSFLQKIPGATRNFRMLAPLYPRAFESFDLREFDVIVSSSSAWAKGVRARADAVHVCYLHTVSRFVFDYERYVGGFGMARLARPMLARLIAWDVRAAQRPTALVCNSRTVQERIAAYYGREAQVLHPPADLARFSPGAGRGDYFFIASRLLPYKRIDLAIEAARAAGVPLRVAGTGPAESALRRRAHGSTTTMLGFVDDACVAALMADAKAVIVPGIEDYGLVPVEAAACGTPVIAFRGGGALETIVDGVTGTFFDDASPQSLAAVLRSFDRSRYDPLRMLEHAQSFSPQRFADALQRIIAVHQDAREIPTTSS